MADILLVIALLSAFAALALPMIARDAGDIRTRRRLTQMLRRDTGATAPVRPGRITARVIAALGRLVLGGAEAEAELTRRLQRAGWHGPLSAELFAGGRLALAAAAGGLAGFLPPWGEPARDAAVAALAAWLLPNLLLGRRIAWREARVRAELPAAIDVVGLALQSGAGIEQSLRFLAALTPQPAPVSLPAFRHFVRDMDRGTPPDLCLARLGERLGVEEAVLFADLLRRSLAHGTELGEPLRALGEELRQRRFAEARASVGRATALMTLVMVVFLLPALLTLLGAPAADAILGMLGGL